MLKSVSSITNAIGALNYKGTWNASTNTPAITSGVGTKGDYYVVSVAGSTALDGISNWGVGEWAVFNGIAWQRVEGGADLNGVNLSVTGKATIADLITAKGSTSVPNATATTIFSLPSTTRVSCVQVFCNLLDGANSASYVVIVYDRTHRRIAVNGNDSSLVISLSGANVQVTQTFGSTQSVDWGYVLSKNS